MDLGSLLLFSNVIFDALVDIHLTALPCFIMSMVSDALESEAIAPKVCLHLLHTRYQNKNHSSLAVMSPDQEVPLSTGLHLISTFPHTHISSKPPTPSMEP